MLWKWLKGVDDLKQQSFSDRFAVEFQGTQLWVAGNIFHILFEDATRPRE